VRKYFQLGALSDIQSGQIVDALSAGATLTKTTTLLGVTAAVSKVTTAYANNGKTASAKRNSGRKPKQIERDCRILKRVVSKNHSKAVSGTRFHLEDPVSTNTV
jgi:hypothetical protein